MRATGIVRRVDDLGRVVIPKEIRRTLRIHEGDPLELYVDHDSVVFQKYCAFNSECINESVRRALSNKSIKFCLYDNYSRIVSNNSSGKFPNDIPEGWSTITEYIVINDIGVYPIIVDQTCLGYLVTENTEYSEYVQGVVDMLKMQLSY